MRFFVNNIDLDMAEVQENKGCQWTILGLLGFCFIAVTMAQIFYPANTTSKAPVSVLPLAKSKQVAKAGIDALEGRKDKFGDGRLSSSDLNSQFDKIGYQLDPVLKGENTVPRVFISALPYDLAMIKQTDERKSLFFRTLLPLVLKINEEIITNRAKVWRLRHRLTMGLALRGEDRIWLNAAFSRYRVADQNFDLLLERMDVVPASLALAQAAEESGWGTSRFAREGNALFGQWTFDPKDKGIVPSGRAEGKTHRIKAFDDLKGSLKAYVRNLNSHKAYQKLRVLRRQMRDNREALNGHKLATALDKYSERGLDYVTGIQAIIDKNNLKQFDNVTLEEAEASATLNSPLI
ncbi:glucosaminidase domain-containing protein [Terasakiella sp. A23]|uniref:glucosaminidase domain-containing protein n=1 Tax=Terasakiella sp. FCG-A23 TaxID=3080561 RepID=UPI0029539BE2|nr:glucosaminidase domain-containing protein [Terasakiella sp. A23]MDV7338105.1 glucosaminidase domain-containing protein [Terasakiella sp. A23]